MTEKRFTMNFNKNTIELDGKFFAYANSVDAYRVLDMLNQLVDENNQLMDDKWMLLKENEQLKERNNNQYTQLNRLWGLMEDKDWETMEQMVEEINTAEERLQREWGTYGDVE